MRCCGRAPLLILVAVACLTLLRALTFGATVVKGGGVRGRRSLKHVLVLRAPEPPAPEIQQPRDTASAVVASDRDSDHVPSIVVSEYEGPRRAVDVASESPSDALRRASQRVEIKDAWRQRRADTFSRYISLHKALVKGRGKELVGVPGQVEDRRRRFLLVEPCCQLCNRVRVLVSALALGMLTGRAVLMDFDGRQAGKKTDYYGRFDDLFDSPLRLQALEVTQGVRGGRERRSLSWLSMMSDVLCDDPIEWDDDVVTIQGSPAFLHTLRLHPSLRGRFDSAFGDLDGLFAAIFLELLRPRAELMHEARAFIHSLASARGAVVGLHIRNGRDFRTKKLTTEEWRQLAACARALEPAQRAATADSGVQYPSPAGAARLGGAAFVIATESEESQAAAEAALGAGATVYRPSLPKGSEGGTTSREGAKRAMIELLIISLSNASVLTPMSSFSETAAALSGRPGVYFHFQRSRKFHHTSATEVLPGCFVPWTAEMPGSMNLHALIKGLRCAPAVRRENPGSLWVAPTGLRFLDGTARLPDQLASKVTSF